MLKKITLLFILSFIINLNSETVDDRNNKSLADDIANAIEIQAVSVEELSQYIQKLPSFLLIFDRNEINIKNTADSLSNKIIQVHNKLPVKYKERVYIVRVNTAQVIKSIKDVRKTLKIPNVESGCIIM